MRIWHSKRNKRDVVIRLNIEDNGSADLVETPTFWPRGVRCRPWLDRNERYHNHNKTHRYHRRTPYVPRFGHAFGRSDVDDYIIRFLHFVTKGTITILINGSKPNDVERHWNYVQFKLLK